MIGYMQTRLSFVVTSVCRCLHVSLALYHVIQCVFHHPALRSPQRPSAVVWMVWWVTPVFNWWVTHAGTC